MKPKVYLETTIPSYLAAWPSRDLIRAAHQQVTREWWADRRADFEVYVSTLVLKEVAAGDSTAAAERLDLLKGLPMLIPTPDATELASALVRLVPLPAKATLDAMHITLSVVNGMDYLLTWNCTHIANATLRRAIEEICGSHGHGRIVICTPDELMGETIP